MAQLLKTLDDFLLPDSDTMQECFLNETDEIFPDELYFCDPTGDISETPFWVQ